VGLADCYGRSASTKDRISVIDVWRQRRTESDAIGLNAMEGLGFLSLASASQECAAALLRVVIQRFTLVDDVNREQL
jgi:hypothetical protein